jgi:hypothetical protein
VQDLRKLLEARRDELAEYYGKEIVCRTDVEIDARIDFEAGADAMLELLMGVIEELEKYHGSPTIGLAAERALTALKLKLEPK